jgi:hypothetical protein
MGPNLWLSSFSPNALISFGVFSCCAQFHSAHSPKGLKEFKICQNKSTLSTRHDDFEGTVPKKIKKRITNLDF